MLGHELFKTISFLEIFLVFSTGSKSFRIPVSTRESFIIASLLTKVTEDLSRERPKDENIGLE